MTTATDMALEYDHAGLPFDLAEPPTLLRRGDVLEGGWVVLSWYGTDQGLTRIMAARDDEGVGVIAEWSLRANGRWHLWTTNTELGHQAGQDDDIPPAPPRRRG